MYKSTQIGEASLISLEDTNMNIHAHRQMDG